MALTTDIALSLEAAIDTVDELGSTAIRRTIAQTERLNDGDGGGQAKRIYSDQANVAGGANGNLNLYTVGTTPGGGFRKVKALAIRVTAGSLVVGGGNWAGATALFADATDKIRLGAGQTLLLVASSGDGWAVGNAAGALNLVAGAAGATYEILIVGTGA